VNIENGKQTGPRGNINWATGCVGNGRPFLFSKSEFQAETSHCASEEAPGKRGGSGKVLLAGYASVTWEKNEGLRLESAEPTAA